MRSYDGFWQPRGRRLLKRGHFSVKEVDQRLFFHRLFVFAFKEQLVGAGFEDNH